MCGGRRIGYCQERDASGLSGCLASEQIIPHLRSQIAKLRREKYGHSAERRPRLTEQLEMQLEDIETAIGNERAEAEAAVLKDACHRLRTPKSLFPSIGPASAS